MGKRLNPRKADLHRWRETFAEKLRGHGVEAEASRQATRGQTQNYDALWRLKARQDGRLRTSRRSEKAGAATKRHRKPRKASALLCLLCLLSAKVAHWSFRTAFAAYVCRNRHPPIFDDGSHGLQETRYFSCTGCNTFSHAMKSAGAILGIIILLVVVLLIGGCGSYNRCLLYTSPSPRD